MPRPAFERHELRFLGYGVLFVAVSTAVAIVWSPRTAGFFGLTIGVLLLAAAATMVVVNRLREAPIVRCSVRLAAADTSDVEALLEALGAVDARDSEQVTPAWRMDTSPSLQSAGERVEVAKEDDAHDEIWTISSRPLHPNNRLDGGANARNVAALVGALSAASGATLLSWNGTRPASCGTFMAVDVEETRRNELLTVVASLADSERMDLAWIDPEGRRRVWVSGDRHARGRRSDVVLRAATEQPDPIAVYLAPVRSSRRDAGRLRRLREGLEPLGRVSVSELEFGSEEANSQTPSTPESRSPDTPRPVDRFPSRSILLIGMGAMLAISVAVGTLAESDSGRWISTGILALGGLLGLTLVIRSIRNRD